MGGTPPKIITRCTDPYSISGHGASRLDAGRWTVFRAWHFGKSQVSKYASPAKWVAPSRAEFSRVDLASRPAPLAPGLPWPAPDGQGRAARPRPLRARARAPPGLNTTGRDRGRTLKLFPFDSWRAVTPLPGRARARQWQGSGLLSMTKRGQLYIFTEIYYPMWLFATRPARAPCRRTCKLQAGTSR